MKGPASGRVAGARGRPTVSVGIISAASDRKGIVNICSAPDNHFAAGPYCCVKVSTSGRGSGASSYPAISAGIVSPTRIQIGRNRRRRRCRTRRRVAIVWPVSVQLTFLTYSSPDNHLVTSPDCRVKLPRNRRTGGADSCPTISAGIVSSARVQIAAKAVQSAPDDHLTAAPHCRVNVPASGRAGGAGGYPTVRAGIISSAGVQKTSW